MSFQHKFAAQALALVGAPFRLHGRDAVTGVDCVGLVALSAERAGLRLPTLPAYRLRGTTIGTAAQALARCGLVPADRAAGEGVVLLVQSGPMQLHLLVETQDGLVHAHAGLGRVVLTPVAARSLWPIAGVWCFPSTIDQG